MTTQNERLDQRDAQHDETADERLGETADHTETETGDSPTPSAESPNRNANETATDETPNLEAEGKQAAKQLLQSVEGDTELSRAESALARKREALERQRRRLAAAKRRRRRTSDRIESLQYTASRLDAAADDRLVLQRLEGGVSIAVPDDERDGVESDLRERKRRLEQQLLGIEDRIETVERTVRTDRIAVEHLQNHRDLVSE